MDPAIRKAWRKAGIKLGGGLLVLGGLIGFRLVTADPSGLEAQLAELEAVEAELQTETLAQGGLQEADRAEGTLAARIKGVVSARSSAGPDPERLVTCRMAGSTHFMRAADCLSRGGTSQDFEVED